jgi:hypothetical protein
MASQCGFQKNAHISLRLCACACWNVAVQIKLFIVLKWLLERPAFVPFQNSKYPLIVNYRRINVIKITILNDILTVPGFGKMTFSKFGPSETQS